MLYLLQLVQALRFEDPPETRRRRKVVDESDSGLSQFLIDRSVANRILGTSFHWFLMIECDTRSPIGKAYAKIAYRFMQKLAEVSYSAVPPGRPLAERNRPRLARCNEISYADKGSLLSYCLDRQRVSDIPRMGVKGRSRS